MKRRRIVRGNLSPSPQKNNNEHLQQARKSMEEYKTLYKKQLTAMKQQSLQTLQESSQYVFDTNNIATQQQIFKQQQEAASEKKRESILQSDGLPSSNSSSINIISENAQRVDAGKQAMNIANKGAEQAMQSAQQSFQEIKKMMDSLKKQKRKSNSSI